MKSENKENFNTEKDLSGEECREIIEGMGLTYLGITQKSKDNVVPCFVLFVSPDPRLNSTSMSVALHELTPENIQNRINETLKEWTEVKSDEEN